MQVLPVSNQNFKGFTITPGAAKRVKDHEMLDRIAKALNGSLNLNVAEAKSTERLVATIAHPLSPVPLFRVQPDYCEASSFVSNMCAFAKNIESKPEIYDMQKLSTMM